MFIFIGEKRVTYSFPLMLLIAFTNESFWQYILYFVAPIKLLSAPLLCLVSVGGPRPDEARRGAAALWNV